MITKLNANTSLSEFSFFDFFSSNSATIPYHIPSLYVAWIYILFICIYKYTQTDKHTFQRIPRSHVGDLWNITDKVKDLKSNDTEISQICRNFSIRWRWVGNTKPGCSWSPQSLLSGSHPQKSLRFVSNFTFFFFLENKIFYWMRFDSGVFPPKYCNLIVLWAIGSEFVCDWLICVTNCLLCLR